MATGVATTEVALAASIPTGALRVLRWQIGLDRLARFLSHGVLVDGIAGLAAAVRRASIASVLVGVTSIALVRLLRRVAPHLPGTMIGLATVGGAVALLEPDGWRERPDRPSGSC